jgi:hypothetical protein
VRRKYLLREKELVILGIILILIVGIILTPHLFPQEYKSIATSTTGQQPTQKSVSGRAVDICHTPQNRDHIATTDIVQCKGINKNITTNMTTYDASVECDHSNCDQGEYELSCPEDCTAADNTSANNRSSTCIAVPEICNNHKDDDCDGHTDLRDADCIISEHAQLPTISNLNPVRQSFSAGIIEGSAPINNALENTVLDATPQGTVYSFKVKSNMTNTSIRYTGNAQSIEVYQKAGTTWNKVTMQTGSNPDEYTAQGLSQGEYVIVEKNIQTAVQTQLQASTPPPATKPTTTSDNAPTTQTYSAPTIEEPQPSRSYLPYILVAAAIVLLASFMVYKTKFSPFKTIDDVNKAPPLIPEQQQSILYKPSPGKRTQIHEARMLFQSELLKGKSSDDAKLELLKQGYDSHTINDVLKEMKK